MTDYKRIHRIDFIEEECIMAKVIEEHVKDPGSAITHFIGMLMAIFAAIPLRSPDAFISFPSPSTPPA